MKRAITLAAVLLAPNVGLANDFIDTRLTWTFGDDDVLTRTAETAPPSPLPRIGDRPGYELFFDNLDTRYSGRENVGHLVLYKKLAGFVPGLVTEAGLVGLYIPGVGISDDGSYIKVAYTGRPDRPDDGVGLTLFPFTTNRFQLGYLYDISWGGDAIFPNASGPAPGAKLQLDMGPGYYFLGLKTASISVPIETVSGSDTDVEIVRVEETQYAVLGGGGWDFTPSLRLDVGGGYFQQGRFDLVGVRGLPVYTFGGSMRLVLHQGIDVGTSVDFKLYRNDPEVPYTFGSREEYVPGRFSWSLSVEGSLLEQHLSDPEDADATLLQPAYATALQLKVKYGYMRGSVIGFFRNLEYILRNVPSFVPFEGLPSEATARPELFTALTLDYHYARARLTPGIMGGVQFPATFASTVSEGSLEASRTLVIRQEGDFDILPPGKKELPIIGARGSLRWDLSDILSSYFFVQYVHDPNATRLVADPGSGTRRIFQRADQLGLGLTVQARY
ncbi:MAG: hypothetical protein HYY06_04750 [Deltaproteobacteria bacterium]|nr:hypothetical protein [Deltaproteobacteria bacterium]